LEYDLPIPAWFSYPEVLSELRAAYPSRKKQGVTIFFSGLSGSGKSTIARMFLAKMLEKRERPVTLLDGDVVRKHLSKGLGFTTDDRQLNVTRIGFVASEITKNGGVAICAPIAPYPESRAANRALISQYGGYVEVYVATSVEICAQRDRKGLYAKAKAGLIKNMTGVQDPYIPPVNPEITIDTEIMNPIEASESIIRYLEEHGYLLPEARVGAEKIPEAEVIVSTPVAPESPDQLGAEALATDNHFSSSYLHLVRR
jgi:sulfate adenylyltransferase